LSALTPDPVKSMAGKIGAHISWANTTDRTARTAKARAALDRKFLDAADGDPIRAESFRKAYYAKLSMASAMARRKPRPPRTVPAEADLTSLGGDPSGTAA
jgi:hypothetical protein